MRELDFWEADRIPEDVVWEVCDTIFTGDRPGAPGARNIDFIEEGDGHPGGPGRGPTPSDAIVQRLRGKPIFALGGHGAQ